MKIFNLTILILVLGLMFGLPVLSVNAQSGTYSISGVVFDDQNKNELKDRYESVIQNWTVTLSGDKSSTQITKIGGVYSFDGLAPGTYKVCQVAQDFWTQNYPKGDGCYNVTITNSDVTEANFGVFHNPDAAVLGESTETPTTDTGTGGGTSSSTTTDGKGEVLGETGAPAWVYALSVGATLMFFIGFIKLTGLKPSREIF